MRHVLKRQIVWVELIERRGLKRFVRSVVVEHDNQLGSVGVLGASHLNVDLNRFALLVKTIGLDKDFVAVVCQRDCASLGIRQADSIFRATATDRRCLGFPDWERQDELLRDQGRANQQTCDHGGLLVALDMKWLYPSANTDFSQSLDFLEQGCCTVLGHVRKH